MNPRLAAAAALLLALPGCSFIPAYQRPPLPVPAEIAAPGASADAPPVARSEWRAVFTDARLQTAIERALASNRDLRATALGVERAAAMYRIQRSDLYPGVGVAASGSRHRIPESMTDGDASTVGEYAVMVGIPAWEIDLFGRIRSLNEAALHQYLASDEARNAAELSIVSAVAGSWLVLGADEEALALARATLEANTASWDLVAKSAELGIASDLEANQARSLVESARADVARLEGAVRTDRNALQLLVGEPVAEDLLPGGITDLDAVAPVPAGLSSAILLARPDIAAAEHRLIAANANIGAARARFFPNVTLTAAVGTLSPEVSGLFGSGSGTWSFAPQALAPLFAGGALRANLRAAQLGRDIAVADYEKAIQQAFAEVSDALVESVALSQERAAVEALVASLGEAHRLANARFEGGIDSYLQVLVVERSLFAARQRLVALRFAEQANRVTLFKVLAGESASSSTSGGAAGS